MEMDLLAAFVDQRAKIARFIALRCGDDDVDDLVHELWLKVRRVGKTVEKPIPYLFRMADRLVLDKRRGASRQRVRDNDWGYVHDVLSTAIESPTAESRLIVREKLEAVEEALQSAGERPRAAFRLYRMDGMEQKDIARTLGVSVSTVEKDLRKILDLLLSLREALYER